MVGVATPRATPRALLPARRPAVSEPAGLGRNGGAGGAGAWAASGVHRPWWAGAHCEWSLRTRGTDLGADQRRGHRRYGRRFAPTELRSASAEEAGCGGAKTSVGIRLPKSSDPIASHGDRWQ